jgi:predicted DNA-binding protein with PD1-like motif
MTTAYHKDNTYILNLARGEEFLMELRKFLEQEQINAGYLTGLGAAGVLDIAYYNLAEKKFERHTIQEHVEILSLVGNIALLKDERIIHAHGTFGRRNLSTFGGHIFSLSVSGACEIHLTKLPGVMSRAHDETTGLNLLCPMTQ